MHDRRALDLVRSSRSGAVLLHPGEVAVMVGRPRQPVLGAHRARGQEQRSPPRPARSRRSRTDRRRARAPSPEAPGVPFRRWARTSSASAPIASATIVPARESRERRQEVTGGVRRGQHRRVVRRQSADRRPRRSRRTRSPSSARRRRSSAASPAQRSARAAALRRPRARRRASSVRPEAGDPEQPGREPRRHHQREGRDLNRDPVARVPRRARQIERVHHDVSRRVNRAGAGGEQRDERCARDAGQPQRRHRLRPRLPAPAAPADGRDDQRGRSGTPAPPG